MAGCQYSPITFRCWQLSWLLKRWKVIKPRTGSAIWWMLIIRRAIRYRASRPTCKVVTICHISSLEGIDKTDYGKIKGQQSWIMLRFHCNNKNNENEFKWHYLVLAVGPYRLGLLDINYYLLRNVTSWIRSNTSNDGKNGKIIVYSASDIIFVILVYMHYNSYIITDKWSHVMMWHDARNDFLVAQRSVRFMHRPIHAALRYSAAKCCVGLYALATR